MTLTYSLWRWVPSILGTWNVWCLYLQPVTPTGWAVRAKFQDDSSMASVPKKHAWSKQTFTTNKNQHTSWKSKRLSLLDSMCWNLGILLMEEISNNHPACKKHGKYSDDIPISSGAKFLPSTVPHKVSRFDWQFCRCQTWFPPRDAFLIRYLIDATQNTVAVPVPWAQMLRLQLLDLLVCLSRGH